MTKDIRGDYSSALETAVNQWAAGYQGRAQQDIQAWRPRLSDADSDHRPSLKLDKARARELAWQDPYGANAIRIHRNSVIGKAYRLSLKIDAEGLGISPEAAHDWNQKAEREWHRYAEGVHFGADASRKNTWTFLMHQAIAGMVIDGEILAILPPKKGWEGYLTCMHLLEPERLVDPGETALEAGLEIRNGIEIDQQGEPLAYYIQRTYPTSNFGTLNTKGEMDYVRVRRMTDWGRPLVLHCFDEHRPNMTRGVSKVVASMKQMKMLGQYSDTELERAAIGASLAAVIESEMNWEEAMRVVGGSGSADFENGLTKASIDHMKNVAPYHQEVGLRFNGSRVAHLLPNEKLHIVQPTVNGASYDKFEKAFIRQIAAGLDVASESLARDFTGTSYSAARMSLADIWRAYLVSRQLLNTKFAMPFVSAWLEESILSGFLPMPDGSEATIDNWVARRGHIVRGTFISWGKPIIDPTKERDGQQKALAMGLTTLEEEAAAEGKDWSELMAQRKVETDHREELGLNPFDIDPTLQFSGVAAAQTRTDGDGAE